MNKLQLYTSIALDSKEYLEKKITNITKEMRANTKILTDKWIESLNQNKPAWELYHSKEYVKDTILCYITLSKACITNTFKFFEVNNIPVQNLSWFDDYNGLGFTTADILARGIKDVSFYNDVKEQQLVLEKLAKEFGYDMPKNDLERSGKYDVVCSFEVIEHYKNPDEYIDKICSMVNEDGFLAVSWTTVMFLGHFYEYNINGKNVSGQNFGREISKRIQNNGFVKIGKAINQKPYIFKKVKAATKEEIKDIQKSYKNISFRL